MRARNRFLVDHSINTALSAIEIYNKPDFKDREQIFCILMTTAWEALLKAKILRDNRNRLNSLYVKSGARFKKTRSGHPLTIGIIEAARQCNLSPVVSENIERLVDVRDAAVHLTADSPSLPYLVFTLGTASLQNYARLVRDWFGVGLGDYSFYILPLGFAYPFRAITPVDLRKEPRDVAAIIRQVVSAQEAGRASDGPFQLVCELRTTLVSAKKITEKTDITASISPGAPGAVIVTRDVNLLDQYPYRFTELWQRIRAALPQVRQQQVHRIIRERQVKSNREYARYNFRNKAEETRGPSKTTPIIYNDAAVRFVIAELSKQSSAGSPGTEAA